MVSRILFANGRALIPVAQTVTEHGIDLSSSEPFVCVTTSRCLTSLTCVFTITSIFSRRKCFSV
jgi:hypothetical protein